MSRSIYRAGSRRPASQRIELWECKTCGNAFNANNERSLFGNCPRCTILKDDLSRSRAKDQYYTGKGKIRRAIERGAARRRQPSMPKFKCLEVEE